MEDPCWVVADCETTGLSPKRDRIISIAASCRGKEFSEFVNPGCPIPAESTEIHHITDEDVREAHSWSSVSERFWEWIKEQADGRRVVIVAHNSKFDTSMIAAEDARLSRRPHYPPLEVVDTLVVCRRKLPGLESYKQSSVYEHLFGSSPEGQHNALFDVQALLRICSHPTISEAFLKFSHALDLVELGDELLRAPKPAKKSCSGPSKCPKCSKTIVFGKHVCLSVDPRV